ncbi:NAD-dependent epimerase/dehydratase family protein [Psychrobacillus sp. FSL K6-1267]|uniref:NAD-dependent epimerase/dehydratase family protein n=1 Tax=Psychrobacillus sp. FSL K6-1267 TaxID=2921543 RepID=UPI0030F6BCB2
MKQKIMITGATGFTGSHACQHFKRNGYNVIAVSRSIKTYVNEENILVEQCDLTNKYEVNKLIQRVQPNYLLHLAGQNHVQESWLDPIASLEANALSTAFLMEALRQYSPPCKAIVVGSALQFNLSNISSLSHPYSLSKSLQVLIAQSWEALFDMNIIIAKPSNLIGPGVSNGVCSILAKQVAELEILKGAGNITVNNLYAQRDFIDVRDAVLAYEKILQYGQSGEVYDISSGRPRFVKDITDCLMALSNVPLDVNAVENISEKIQAVEPKALLDIGWNPSIPFENSMEDILNYHRELLK